MRAISDLNAALAKVNVEAVARAADTAANPMASIAQSLPQRANNLVLLPSSGRLTEALRRFRTAEGAKDFRTLRLLCHGCTNYLADDQYVLLGDASALRSLLDDMARHSQDPRRFRRLFDGLLRAYLGVDRKADWFRDASAKQGNEHLRKFLKEAFEEIRRLEPKPDWVRALESYPEVLSPDPGSRFAHEWLRGNSFEFNDASRGLSLTGVSWLAAETLRAALQAAAAQDDPTFTSHIPALLAAAGEKRFLSLRDETYAGLLIRYASIPSPPVHAELRDALVGAWKNPWLSRNDSTWGQRHIPDSARKMVAGWLKLELIHQFFEVLSEDGRQDQSRFQFWRGYHEQMDDVYFALGSRSYHSRSPDTVKLRHALDGRLLELTGTEADNNAFIMCMGEVVVVEFSKKGNAAYRYSRSELLLDSSQRTIRISGLKHDSTQRMLHAGARGLTWQERFARVLGPPSSARTARTTPVLGSRPARTDPGRHGQRRPSTLQEISTFARHNGIAIEDHRTKGGNLWLRVDDADPAVVEHLAAWGFAYRPGRGWWRSGP